MNVESERVPEDQLFHLSNNDCLALSFIPFYIRMMREKHNILQLSEIIHRLCIKNEGFSEAIGRALLQLLQETLQKDESVENLLMIFDKIINISDEFHLSRLNMLLGYSQPILKDDNRFSRIDQTRFRYVSTIDSPNLLEPFVQQMFNWRYRAPLNTILMLRAFLKWNTNNFNPNIYLAFLSGPNYMCKFYFEWFMPYLNQVATMFLPSAQNPQQLNELISECNDIYNGAFLPQIMTSNSIQTPFFFTGKIAERKIRTTQDIGPLKERVEDVILNCVQGETFLVVNPFARYLNQNCQLSIPNCSEESDILNYMYNTAQSNRQANQGSEQQQPESPKTVVNIPGSFLNDHFRMITIENNSDHQTFVQLKFKRQHNQNVILPTSAYAYVKPRSSQILVVLTRLYCTQPWPELQYNYQYSEANTHKNQLNQVKSYRIYDRAENNQPGFVMPVVEETKQQNQRPATIQCQVCTFINESLLADCEMCGSPLQTFS